MFITILLNLISMPAQALDISTTVFPTFEDPQLRKIHDHLEESERHFLGAGLLYSLFRKFPNMSNEVQLLARRRAKASGDFPNAPRVQFLTGPLVDDPINVAETRYLESVQELDGATGEIRTDLEGQLKGMEQELDDLYGSHGEELRARRNYLVNQMRDPGLLEEAKTTYPKKALWASFGRGILFLMAADWLLRKGALMNDRDPGFVPLVALPLRVGAKGLSFLTGEGNEGDPTAAGE